ncbi:MAG TPA: imidazole glycerol phosphate synthase subunit HisH [Vicinamibacterales bacterium]|nr:imidazole glycerol phosphate synthase subunit HisH [Vicinamibacterales bacterium]
MTIALIDYGAGNLASVRKAFAAIGAPLTDVACPADLGRAGGIVIPGVGHFDATAPLQTGWKEAIARRAAESAAILGICLGMQWLFEGSEESSVVSGLGWFRGRCLRLTGDVKVPHVGWNSLNDISPRSRLLTGITGGASMYFTHAYAAPATPAAAARTTHGTTFVSVVERGRVFGTQGHPEKSGGTGLRLLSNFAALARERSC